MHEIAELTEIPLARDVETSRQGKHDIEAALEIVALETGNVLENLKSQSWEKIVKPQIKSAHVPKLPKKQQPSRLKVEEWLTNYFSREKLTTIKKEKPKNFDYY